MQAVIMCTDKEMPRAVYGEETVKRIERYVSLDKTVYDGADVRSNPQLFLDTEYIFSTWSMPQFKEDEVRKYFPKLKCIFLSAGTVQYFARPFMAHGVKVFSAWAANGVPVAEYTVAQIILANKGFYTSSRIKSKQDYTEKRKIYNEYIGNYNAKIGILGAGMIGKKVIELLKPYHLDVLVYDKFLTNEQADKLGVKKSDLEEIFKTCNVVSNHLANNPQTVGMIGKNMFLSMPQNATFINTGRGAQVVEEDLINALEKRQDLLAVLDVTEPEPPQEKSKLYLLDNCILTPHIAGSFGNEVLRLSEYMADEFESYINNNPVKYEVTAEMLETMA